MTNGLRFHGLHAGQLLPFTADLAIDEPAYRKHLRWLADTPGVTGIVANGHAAEVASLDARSASGPWRSRSTRSRARSGRHRRLLGRNARGGRAGARCARGGAAGLLVFPPTLFMWGAQLKPDMVLRHFQTIADAVDLPLIVFEYPLASGIGYSPETLAELCKIPTVAAVKDWSNEIVSYEKNLRALRGTGRPVAMLSSFTMSLMSSFVLGADGCISGMGSVAADLQADLYAAVRPGDLDEARAIDARLTPLVRVNTRPVRGHAQSHEGGARDPRPHPGRPRAAAAHTGLRGQAAPDPPRATGVGSAGRTLTRRPDTSPLRGPRTLRSR